MFARSFRTFGQSAAAAVSRQSRGVASSAAQLEVRTTSRPVAFTLEASKLQLKTPSQLSATFGAQQLTPARALLSRAVSAAAPAQPAQSTVQIGRATEIGERFQALNRNARRPKKANRGKRAVSHVMRKSKRMRKGLNYKK
eukprot:CAMPEP_0184542434 /NCGR_PEP_ID=MMETSP0199_2-20130426/2040_1 /TAXON_ID=1112570 /ORGANISM="Thraustochytrium sp., Strain LLF1b" /LENGTH=140 /DNA_ID=CAMNT_0026936231 /DNA_START=23 /DNA_END=445 /DNA_ORIENTATION=-